MSHSVVFCLLVAGALSGPASAEDPFRFRDVLAEQGIDPVVNAEGFRTHAAAWGDVDGDGWIDLYVGTMGGDEPAAFFWNDRGRFKLMKQHPAAVLARAAGSVLVDLDNDGRLDLFLSRGNPKTPSLLLRNETPGGHWLDVTVRGTGKLNRQGVGTVVRAYQSGRLGERAGLLACEEIAVGYGHSSGQPAVAHLGLGTVSECDLEIVFPHGRGSTTRSGVKADHRLVIEN